MGVTLTAFARCDLGNLASKSGCKIRASLAQPLDVSQHMIMLTAESLSHVTAVRNHEAILDPDKILHHRFRPATA